MRVSVNACLIFVMTLLISPVSWATTPIEIPCETDEDCPSLDCVTLDGEETGVCNEPYEPPEDEIECDDDEDCEPGQVCMEGPELSDGATRRTCVGGGGPAASEESDDDAAGGPDASSDEDTAESSGCQGGPATPLVWLALGALGWMRCRRSVDVRRG